MESFELLELLITRNEIFPGIEKGKEPGMQVKRFHFGKGKFSCSSETEFPPFFIPSLTSETRRFTIQFKCHTSNHISPTGITELHAGCYFMYDTMQRDIGACSTEDIAISVRCTVISVYNNDSMLVDMGWTATSAQGAGETSWYNRCVGCRVKDPLLDIYHR